MELSLFSRDVIAMSTAIALSHGMFKAALVLGICDMLNLPKRGLCHAGRSRTLAHDLAFTRR